MNPKTVSRLLVAPVLVAMVLLSAQAAPSRAAPAFPDAAAAKSGFANQFSYLNIAGSSLHARASSTSWSYTGAGCVSVASGNDLFVMHIDLPEGSRVDYLRLYTYDTSAADSRAWLTYYDGAGNWKDMVNVTSSGTAGYASRLTSYAGHVINGANNAYVVQWEANQTGSSMRLCGIRIAYRLPVTYTYIPRVLR